MLNINGQVATTIITAQPREKRKGRRIHRQEAISRPIKRTARVERAISVGWFMVMALQISNVFQERVAWGKPPFFLPVLLSASASPGRIGQD
jgi:hypothetical protein